MRIPLKWLAEYVDIALPAAELAHRLTLAGVQTEAATGDAAWEGISVAQVVEVTRHPNADRLRLATVHLGDGERMTVVCGAPNVAPGQKVAFARLGAHLIDGHTGQPMTLTPAVIRGVESAGMVCSEKELGLSDSHEGILVLPEDAPLGMPLAQYLGEVALEAEVTPNRPDLLAVVGIAREVAALTGASVREPDAFYEEDGPPIRQRAAVAIADPDLCPRYCAALIEGVRVGPSPAWIQERLAAAGMRPINNVVDITNYVMLELGQPLHAFDFALVGGRRVVVRRARPGERLQGLDGVERELKPDMLVIADAEVAMALAGIMGGAHTQVSEATTAVLLESANFNPASIRRTSTALGLRTEASLRFEKGLGPELAMAGIRRAVKLLVELAGGRAAKGIIDAYPGKVRTVRIMVARERLRRVLGLDLPTARVRQHLASLGFGCRWVSPAHYVVRVPYWRSDIRIPDDVAEELGRIIGYDDLPSSGLKGAIPMALPSALGGLRELRGQVQDALAAAGLQEVINYSLTDMESLARVLSTEELAARPPLRVANPMSRRQEYLRTSLRASLLETLATNRRFGRETVAIFEVGRVYLPRPDDLPQEVEMAAGLLCGRRPDRWGTPRGKPLDFYDAKGCLQRLFASLGIRESYADAEEFGLVPGRTSQVLVEGQRVGAVGQVHPSALGGAAAWDIGDEVYLFEVDLEALLSHIGGPRRYQPIFRFPPLVEDLAVVVDEAVAAARVQAAIEGFPLVRRAELFDVYTGPPVPAGKRSLAFSVTYQAADHTLSDAEVERERRRIIARLRGELGAELRR